MPAPVIGKKTATEAELFAGSAILANRRGMTVQNRGANPAYISPDMPQHVYGACGTGLTTELRIVEW